MEFKGTSGKWQIEKNYNRALEKYGLVVRGNFEGCLSGESVVFIGTAKKVFPEYQIANAQLISKAPQMLEMLKRVEDFLYKVQAPVTSAINLQDDVKELIKEATELLS